ncbi:HAD-like protein [Sodiomyces alkalinus F11]|uniref:Mitochondrial import inner membrane translocase subunit TIM50 n=1 Tax=Sodiomyces alkalinus (strain CBS 110278 / VKM F-3762 / F11) TaxID=1314773 RepID=A0A3N2Q225_SODAK|nr:HAD-like protein [Sodiomyces alkalinus F11]ROT40823.1 HAD-like protein [Sodiomyces alkalinus F11]
MAPRLSRVLVGALFSQSATSVAPVTQRVKQAVAVHRVLLRTVTRQRNAFYSSRLPTSRLKLLDSRTIYNTVNMDSNNPSFNIPFPLQFPPQVAGSQFSSQFTQSHGFFSATASSSTHSHPSDPIPEFVPIPVWLPSSAEPSSIRPSMGGAKVPKGPKRKGPKPRQQEAPLPGGRSAIVAPSPRSGGIPEPSRAYLEQSALPPSLLPRPRAILVVMDLNGTLLFRPDRRQSHKFIERPFARDFMRYAISTFRVAVWSSARPQNVATMCAQLLGGTDSAHHKRLVAVWGRDKFGLCPEDYSQRVQCYKRLARLWADPAVQASHPDAARGGAWDQSNTVLVDDSLEKARSEPFNLLRIPEFSGGEESLHVLPQVHDYLNLLCYQADVSRYIHTHPFQLRHDYTLESPSA